jgi:hypothetical protein
MRVNIVHPLGPLISNSKITHSGQNYVFRYSVYPSAYKKLLCILKNLKHHNSLELSKYYMLACKLSDRLTELLNGTLSILNYNSFNFLDPMFDHLSYSKKFVQT